MKTLSKNLKAVFFIGLVAVMSFATVGCKKNRSEEPSLPPSNTFVMDFSEFGGKSLANPYENVKPMPEAGDMKAGSNWNHAAGNVLVWNVVLWVSTAVPTYAFIEAFNHEAKWSRKEKKWLWEYDYFILGVRHTAQLYGHYQSEGGNVIWEMYVSKQDDWQDVLWFTGVVDAGGETGTWTLNNNPNNPTPFLEMLWTKNADGTADIRYTNIIPGDAGNGGYIEFGTQNGTYDRFYNIYNAENNNLTAIQWNHLSHDGEVIDEAHFGDSDNYCWDTLQENVVCQ